MILVARNSPSGLWRAGGAADVSDVRALVEAGAAAGGGVYRAAAQGHNETGEGMSKGRRVPPAPGEAMATLQGLIGELRTAASDNPRRELLLAAAAQLEDMLRRMKPTVGPRGEVEIHVASLLSARTGEPVVTIGIGETMVQASPEQARAHALATLEAADAAESDAVLMAFAVDRLNLELPQAVQLLGEFRVYREKRRGEGAKTA